MKKKKKKKKILRKQSEPQHAGGLSSGHSGRHFAIRNRQVGISHVEESVRGKYTLN